MLVKISKYPKTWITSRLYDNHMTKKYGVIWPDANQTKFENFLEKTDEVIQGFYNVTINKLVKYRKQKIKVRIDDYDTWNMDHTLAHIILPMLRQLKETKHGSPSVDDEDVPEHLRSTAAPPKKNEWDTDENFFKRWDYVLDEMIYTFECEVDDNWDSQFHSGNIDFKFIKEETGDMHRLEKGPNDTHVFDEDSYTQAMNRRNKAMLLFGKYYHSLWD
jgi:hypothetical protein